MLRGGNKGGKRDRLMEFGEEQTYEKKKDKEIREPVTRKQVTAQCACPAMPYSQSANPVLSSH